MFWSHISNHHLWFLFIFFPSYWYLVLVRALLVSQVVNWRYATSELMLLTHSIPYRTVRAQPVSQQHLKMCKTLLVIIAGIYPIHIFVNSWPPEKERSPLFSFWLCSCLVWVPRGEPLWSRWKPLFWFHFVPFPTKSLDCCWFLHQRWDGQPLLALLPPHRHTP